jgi:PAS domain S-box-containing protein
VSRRVPGLNAALPILDVLGQPVVVTDLKTAIFYWNQAATDLYGFRPDEALGQSIQTLLKSPSNTLLDSPGSMAIEDTADALIGRGRSWTRQLEGRSRSGRKITVLLTMTPLRGEDGTPAALIGTAVNVTAAAKYHRGVEEEMALAVESSARLELEAELARVSKEAERGRLNAEADRLTAEDEKAVAEGVRIEAEADRLTAEDEKAVAEGVRLEAAAHSKELEAQLHQSQRLEALGQLAGGVAHDFNNLLSVILNYASLVSEKLSDAAESEAGTQWDEPLRDIEQIEKAGERARLLTRQLLLFARREVVQARPLSLNSAITQMEQILRRTIGQQIELVVNLAPNLPPILADPGQLEQIILNLAINARDAMPSGGMLSIDTEVTEISECDTTIAGVLPGPYVHLRVSDTGQGMSAEVRDRAFEPFFTTKPRGEGSGLGLATIYGIVSQSGGYSKIYSDVGIGTSISIFLPVAARDATGTVIEQEHFLSPPSGTETILVVDDEEPLRDIARRRLASAGYNVIIAADGDEAIRAASSQTAPIDLILTDVIMPKMQGPTVVNEVRKLWPEIKVLFMSGHAQPVLEAEGVLGTKFALLDKPFDKTNLLVSVRKALDCDV